MQIPSYPALLTSLLVTLLLTGCPQTRQLSVENPSLVANSGDTKKTSETKSFQAMPGFSVIDGDDYYVRLTSEFETKAESRLQQSCSSLSPEFKKEDLSSALIFTVRNTRLQFNNEVAGYSYQASAGNCNVKFEAKKVNLTPWLRLDLGKDTSVDYSVLSSANSNVDVAGLVNKVTAASNLLAFTGVGMGVAVLGQAAGQWYNYNQQQKQANPPPPQPVANQSAETHTLPAFVSYANNSGTLRETRFKVYTVAEGGINPFGSENQLYGELKLTPELKASLLLKTNADGVPDARDLSISELGYIPVKSATGDINLQQLLEQSHNPEKPNFKPDWSNYDAVQSNCRKIKLAMKDLGFNKFDRNAYLYYFLKNSSDWLNYNISPQRAQSENISTKTLQSYRSKNFGNCLNSEDFAVMKVMGLPVNTESDLVQMGDTSQKKEQFFAPLKAIERQLVAILKNTNKAEMESQLFPLISTASKGEGTVLLQNRLGEFGLEKLLQPAFPTTESKPANPVSPPDAKSAELAKNITATALAAPVIPGQGLVVTAHQMAEVIAALKMGELSCARVIPEQLDKPTGNTGVLLFTTQPGSLRAKGGAMEFEFSGGNINRIAFQTATYRDLEQHLVDFPEVGGCKIDAGLLAKLH